MDKKTKVIGIGAFCIAIALMVGLFVVFQVRYNQIKSDIKGIKKDISEYQKNNQIADEEREYALNKKLSLINSLSISCSSYNVDEQSADMDFKVVPKAYLPDLKIYILSDDIRIDLVKDGDEYIGTHSFGFNEEVTPNIYIEENGVANADYLYQESVGKAIYTLIPEIIISGGPSIQGNKVIDDFLQVSKDDRGSMVDGLNKDISTVKYRVLIDEKEVRNTEVKNDINNIEGCIDVLRKSKDNIFSVKDGQQYQAFLNISLSDGCEIEYKLYDFKFEYQKENHSLQYNDNFIVRNQDGNIIYDSCRK